METGTKQLRVRGNIRHTGTTWIVGQASRLSPFFWFRRIITTTNKEVQAQQPARLADRIHARRIMCFRHLAGRSARHPIIPRRPRFRHRKHLISNDNYNMPAYSTLFAHPHRGEDPSITKTII